MEQNYNVNDWTEPCPKYDCRKTACKCGLKYVNIPMSLGDDSAESSVAPKNGVYCNALVVYEANGHVYIYSQEGVPTLIDVDASDISTLEQEVIKAQKDVHELREELDEFIHGFNTVADMKSTNTLSDGDYAETYGFYSLNDGGGAKYKIRTRTNSDVIDDMFIFPLLNNISLVAELVLPDSLHSKQVGLKGDGITDETDKLNTFFEKTVSCNKRVLDNGVYKTSDTVYIKGTWRQNTGNNGQKIVAFENATIKYTGVNNDASIVFYNMFKYKLDGICVGRDSNPNYVEMVGLWHAQCNNFDIQNLYITNSTTNLTGKTYATKSDEYISFHNCYILGELHISTDDNDSYINVLTFIDTVIYSTGHNYSVVYTGTDTKQDITFINCDMSYASTAVFNISETQTGLAGINCIGCYFDSGIKVFKDDNKNGVEFNNLFSMFPAITNNEVVNLKYTDFINNTNLGAYGQFGWNIAQGGINYAYNGDMSATNTFVDAEYSQLFGASSSAWTKEYVDSNLSPSGKARKITAVNAGVTQRGISIKGLNAPRTDYYTAYVRFKVISGSFDYAQLSFAQNFVSIKYDRIQNDEILMINSKRRTKLNIGDAMNMSFDFYDSTADLAIEFYEVGIVEGKTYVPNAKLHAEAVL